jgi:hypothetical protein
VTGSPAKYGSATRPLAPGGVAPASLSSSSNDLSLDSERIQLVRAPEVAVGPIMMYLPGNTPGMLFSTLLARGSFSTPAMPRVVP